ncbi:MAG: TetR/AcrR family transcriptional regulator [Pseudomonadota bacterium]
MPKQQIAEMTKDAALHDRRDMIVSAATRCFVAKGFHQTGIRDIAAEAGISLGNLYNHFQNKDALIAEIARMDAEALQEILESLREVADPRQALAQFLDCYLDYSAWPENVALTVEITAEAFRNRDVAKAFAVNRGIVTNAVSDILKKGIKAGEFDASLNTEEVSEFILGAVESLALRLAFRGRQDAKPPRETLHAMVMNAIRRQD